MLFRRNRFDRQLKEELRAHLAEREAAYIRDGLTPEDARRRAALDFGNPAVIHEQSRDVWLVRWLDNIRRDLAIAFRTLRRTPAFSAAAVATFALGIGAATAIFSVAYGVAFRPLPYPDADRIVRIYENDTRTNDPKHLVSVGTFQAWLEGASSLESLALFGTGGRTRYTAGDLPQPIVMTSVSPAFFDVFGVSPLLGRAFKPEAAYTRFTARELVISYGAWQRLFGGDRNVVGRALYLARDDEPMRIVGVMPRDFAFGAFDAAIDGWRPQLVEPPVGRLRRSWRYDRVIARLGPGRTIDDLRVELDAVSARLAREFPSTNAGWTATVEPLRDAIIGRFGTASWLLLAAVGALLLVACANVAGLLTARAMGRTRETAIRVALGAGRSRLAQLWLTETVVLAAVGASAGVAIAWWLVRLLRAAAPPGLPRAGDIAVDLPALLVACSATIVSAVACAAVPLLSTREPGVPEGLNAGAARAGDMPARRHVSAALVALQSGAALALVVVSVVFGRSFLKLTSVDLGWRPANVVGLHLDPRAPSGIDRPWAWYAHWAERLVARLETVPGISRAAVTTSVPFSGQIYPAEIARGRSLTPNETRWPIGLHMVTTGYVDTLRLTVTRGRWFTAEDRFSERVLVGIGTDTPPGVAVVTESVARTLWPGMDPIGRQFRVPAQGDAPFYTVVGVAGEVRFTSVGGEPALEVFLPWLQEPTGGPRLVVRATTNAAAMIPAVRAAVFAEHPATGIDRVAVVETLVDRATAPARLTRNLVAGLGLLALILAAVGVYGALAMRVNAHARETAVRIALGASPAHTLRRTLLEGLAPVFVGALAGLAAAMLLIAGAQSLLFGIARADAASLLTGAGVVLVVTALACLAPALRAARTDPLAVLRGD